MKLHEYQSKKLLELFGIPVPKSKIIFQADRIHNFFDEFSGQLLLKAQVISGGRGRTGGIRLAKTRNEAEEIASALFASDAFCHPINKILIEELVDFDEGYLIGFYINEKRRMIELRGSSSNKLWKNNQNLPGFIPESTSVDVNPYAGIQDYAIRDLAISMGLNRSHWSTFVTIVQKMWEIFTRYDAVKVEINPLAVRKDDGFVSLGVKIDIDDNALFRQLEVEEMFDESVISKLENDARKAGLSYVKMVGEIGCIANGQGISLAIIDLIKRSGCQSAGYINLGSYASAQKAAEGIRIFNEDPLTRIILINICGELTSCTQIVQGIISQLQITKDHKPLVVRLMGKQKENVIKMLTDFSVDVVDTMLEAVSLCKSKIGDNNEHPG